MGPHQSPSSAKYLSLCLKRVHVAAKEWAKRSRPMGVSIASYELVISFLNLIEERHPLSFSELILRRLVRSFLSRLIANRATYWRQRGKVRHCISGDENTAYHHQCATIRLQLNNIKLLRVDDTPVFSHSGKESILFNFFKDLLGSSGHSTVSFDLGELFADSSLDSFQAEALILPFESFELKLVVLGMNNNASPGPDGFGPAFYKSFWDLSMPNIMPFMSNFFARHADLKGVNKSYLILILKKPGTCSPNDFRPISLQNTSTNLSSKTLTSRLQPLIPFLIHADHTGFIKG